MDGAAMSSLREGDAVQAAAGKNENITIKEGPTSQSVAHLELHISFNCTCRETCAEKHLI